MKLKNVARGKCKLFGGLALVALQLVRSTAAEPSTVAQFKYPFQNPNLAVEERINNAVSLMTLDEKINFLHFRAGVHRLGIPPLNSAEGLHGEALGGMANWTPHPPIPTTIFPQAIGLAETWDPEILQQAAAAEGYEARYVAQSDKYLTRAGWSFLRRTRIWDATRAGAEPRNVTAKILFSTAPWSSRLSKACRVTIRVTGKPRRCSNIFWPTATKTAATVRHPISTSGFFENIIPFPFAWALRTAARARSWPLTIRGMEFR